MAMEAKLQAHRGVASDYPENTMAAYRAAIEEGYAYIELDPAYTKDGVLVVFHDAKINRTARNKDGSPVGEEIFLSSLSYAELSEYDFGVAFSEKFKGEPIPLLRDALALAKHHGVKVKIDNKVEKFPEEIKSVLFELLSEFGDTVALTTASVDMIVPYAEMLPEAEIHYDGLVDEEMIGKLPGKLGERLVVWMPQKNSYTWWVTVPYASAELCRAIKEKHRLGLWLIDDLEDYDLALRELVPDIVETSGKIKPKV